MKNTRREELDCYPKLHFAPKYGWINDPNGLVYHDGIFELYYQTNPNGVEWDDMTWEHARSTDLIHWEELEPVMYPDENGMMYSGCGLRNDKEVLGLPKNALLFPYTAALFSEGFTNQHFTIRLAYSTDGVVTEFLNLGRNLIDRATIVYDRGIIEVTTKDETIVQMTDFAHLRTTICSRVSFDEGSGKFKLGIVR